MGCRLGTAFGAAPHFYDMDNEIDIWAERTATFTPVPQPTMNWAIFI